MRKNQLAVILLAVSFILCCRLYGQDVPEAIQKLGFSQSLLLSYDKEGNEEFFTFKDPSGDETGETVTLVVEDGKVKQTIHGQTAKFLEQTQ